jgi:hypothetical protein
VRCLAADVVEILQYVCKNRRKQLERHRSWLPFARTQSARHKLQKFVREETALESCDASAGQLSGNGTSPLSHANGVATLDNMLPGAGFEAARRAVPGSDDAPGRSQQVESVWISLSCRDRTGVLAEAASTIAAHGYNILVSHVSPASITLLIGVLQWVL